ncbi:MAG: hypothetical protein IJA07_05140 [Agathobacter sp.]|nr:hypothetical protein [Agathobacter sp.]
MEKLQLYNNKVLKLSNVLQYQIDLSEKEIRPEIQVEQMQSYIKAKGAMQIGPLIEYTHTFVNEVGELKIEICFLLQCNNFICSVEQPYQMESILRVPNCMYCRYIGPEEKLSFAYDKIHLEAFENDIELEDCSYTIFVDRNEEDETIVADVFIPRKDAK